MHSFFVDIENVENKYLNEQPEENKKNTLGQGSSSVCWDYRAAAVAAGLLRTSPLSHTGAMRECVPAV